MFLSQYVNMANNNSLCSWSRIPRDIKGSGIEHTLLMLDRKKEQDILKAIQGDWTSYSTT